MSRQKVRGKPEMKENIQGVLRRKFLTVQEVK